MTRFVWRKNFILKIIKDKNILDIGSCNENKTKELFKDYKKSAKSVQGIDIRKCGPEVIIADAQNFNLNKKFDLIVVGEVIEHMSNFQGFFNSCKKHMKKIVSLF